MLLVGTYAWQSFSQRALNETIEYNPADQGTRLHNDFNGENTDIYVENYATSEGYNGYTRIRLYEYMEIGDGAGDLVDRNDDISIIRGDLKVYETPDINEVSTWDISLFEGGTGTPYGTIREYIELEYGDIDNDNEGATIYMPTFNKDFESLVADINGTLNNLIDRTEGDRVGAPAYDNYVEYELTDFIEKNATYNVNSSVAQSEGATEILEKHDAQRTLTGYVISMSEWKSNGYLKGDFWVYDVDGWAYWCNDLMPQTATSLLVDSITSLKIPDKQSHYGLHAVNQSATVSGWEDKLKEMLNDDITDDGRELLEFITGLKTYDITGVHMDELLEGEEDVAIGTTLNLNAWIETSEPNPTAKELEWLIVPVGKSGDDDINGTIIEGNFTPISTMHGNSYNIIARSVCDNSKMASVEVYVYDIDQLTMTISTTEVYDSIIAGYTYGFKCEIDGLRNQNVIWETEGTVTSDSKISTDGQFTIGLKEIAGSLTVTASSVVVPQMKKDYNLALENIWLNTSYDIISTDAGKDSVETVMIDDVEFYVLSREMIETFDEDGNSRGERQVGLLFSKNSVQLPPSVYLDAARPTASAFHNKTTNSTMWNESYMKDFVLPAWLETMPTLELAKAYLKLETHGKYSGTTESIYTDNGIVEKTLDDVFVLSESEFLRYVELNRSRAENTQYYWLRSESSTTGAVRYVASSGAQFGNNGIGTNSGVRPAIWVYL